MTKKNIIRLNIFADFNREVFSLKRRRSILNYLSLSCQYQDAKKYMYTD